MLTISSGNAVRILNVDTNMYVQNTSGKHPGYRHNLHYTKSHKKHHLALPTPVNVDALSTHLEGYSNAEFILNGFEHGFMINFDGPEIPLQFGSWSL